MFWYKFNPEFNHIDVTNNICSYVSTINTDTAV